MDGGQYGGEMVGMKWLVMEIIINTNTLLKKEKSQ